VERLHLLGAALGLAALAGLNLYLTVFATGLAIHFGWIDLAPQFQSLAVLGDPIVIWIAGILYAVEFLADKIPWIDSAWDAAHTVIRPIGGALLAIQVLGHPSPTYSVVVALLAGTTSLLTHSAKASTRLVSNTSPEPFSNIALSLGEDATVVGGLALIHYNPLVALGVFVTFLCAFAYFAPKLFRAARAKLFLIFQKLNFPADVVAAATLPIELPKNLAAVWSQQDVLGETIAWAVPCLSGKGRGVPANLFGALVATNEEPRKIAFIARKGRRPFARAVELADANIAREPKFLSENLVIFSSGARTAQNVFVFPRSRAATVERIVADLRERTARTETSALLEPVGAI
jgi:hypothetical protein